MNSSVFNQCDGILEMAVRKGPGWQPKRGAPGSYGEAARRADLMPPDRVLGNGRLSQTAHKQQFRKNEKVTTNLFCNPRSKARDQLFKTLAMRSN